ncbi:predicted protein [Histoplasma capsulatum H143]|uniref:J domain-containing protein n=1 Tax=Ajellomyces capsulatus (strain H143) TaxID=544712 RepID=C6H7D2_AJECH|nr:predicted protein [Histoplasma capsulatum H143]
MKEPEEIDCYRVLKVSKGATLLDIKKSYRKRILETHPDKNPGAETAPFVKVQSAWEILSNASKRYCFDCKYDRIKREWDKYEEVCVRSKTTTGTQKPYTEKDVREILERLRRRNEEADALRKREDERRAREKRQQEEERRKMEERRKKEEQERKRDENKYPRNQDTFDFRDMRDVLDDIEGLRRGRAEKPRATRLPTPSPRRNDRSYCHHDRWWPYVYGAGSCQYCDRYCPHYLLGCPSCDARACVPCKIRETSY